MCNLMTTAKQTFQKYKMLIPVLVLTGLCVFTVVRYILGTNEINGEDYNFMLTAKHYGAFVAVTVNLISFFAFRQYFKYIFGVTILLGLFCIINFTPVDIKWTLRIGSIKIGFQPTAFLVGLLTFVLNFKDKILTFDSSNGEVSEQNLQDNQKRFDEEVENFKQKYFSYSSEDLTQLIADKRYTASALEAARQILNERQVNTI
jgi:hypothetical protein